MQKDLFTIGPLTIHGYGLMIGIGVLAAILLTAYRAKKRGIDPDIIFGLGIVLLVSGFFGAKLLYCLLDAGAFFKNPLELLTNSGFVVYGGIIGGVLGAFLYCRIKKLPFLQILDLIAPSVALAQGFGRIGCFFAGCCYGRETSSWLYVEFQHSDLAPNGVHLIPTQLISSAGDFLFALILLLYARKARPEGRTLSLYFILYSAGRFIIEFFRNDYRGSIGFLSTSQFIALITLVFGVGLYFYKKRVPMEEKV